MKGQRGAEWGFGKPEITNKKRSEVDQQPGVSWEQKEGKKDQKVSPEHNFKTDEEASNEENCF